MAGTRTPREAKQDEGRSATARESVSSTDLLPAILKPGPEDDADSTDDVFEDIRFVYESTPRPPKDLWDSEDATLLELAKCRAFVRVVDLDPKKGTYRLRMKCLWVFRTLNSKEEAEIALRGVPGVRMPGLVVTVEESRIWKDMSCDYASATTTSTTLCWRGITLLTLDGFKAFNMADFPYDRHTLHLERIEFVWRTHKDDDDYFKSMRLVFFEVRSSSMLPEWKAFPAYIRQLNETLVDGRGMKCSKAAPTYASKFTVHLRLQRKHRFYLWQVFLVSYLITLLSISPLSMPPDADTLPERIGLYSAGMLTLVAFQYGVSDHLPCVPYLTFADYFLLGGVATIFLCSMLTLYPWRLTEGDEWHKTALDWVENVSAWCIMVAWTACLYYAWYLKPKNRVAWRDVLKEDFENMDPFGREERDDLLIKEDKSVDGRSGVWDFLDAPGKLFSRGKLLASLSPAKAATAFEREMSQCPVEEWTVRQVAEFIESLGFGHCLHHFKENAVDGRMLETLEQRDFEKELHLLPLQAKKVIAHLNRLKPAPPAKVPDGPN